MASPKETYDFKLIAFTAVAVIVVAAAFFFFWENTKTVIRHILESQFTYFIVWTITVLIFILHYWRHKDKEVKSEVIFTKKFGSFFDNAFGGVAYGTVITTSLTLLKGLYVQQFFEDKIFFTEFKEIDLMTVFGVMIFLLYFSAIKVVDVAKETYKIQHTEQVLNADKQIVKSNRTEDDSNND
ncbi:hypothetical protein [Roseivirga sp.]|uniref:hypothetical protein n=1 Tax=Roseivirga sp. TaxID=1964215 RepID=UPI002B2735B6|nr:hypothetical protein [Roseivirga sp.]